MISERSKTLPENESFRSIWKFLWISTLVYAYCRDFLNAIFFKITEEGDSLQRSVSISFLFKIQHLLILHASLNSFFAGVGLGILLEPHELRIFQKCHIVRKCSFFSECSEIWAKCAYVQISLSKEARFLLISNA